MIGAAHLMMRQAGVSQPKGLFAWGLNTYGQLGLGDRTSRSSPVQIGSLTTWLKIVATNDGSSGYVTAFGIKSDGTLWAWGDNAAGIINGSATLRFSSPVQIGSNTNWTDAGGGSSLGFDMFGAAIGVIKTTGTLWTWGNNLSGQLGLGGGLGNAVSSPTQLGSDTNWSKVGISESGYAIKTTGTLWTWGANGSGQLGLGDRTSYSSPVQVGSDSTWVDIQIPANTALAVKTNGTLWVWGYSAGALGRNEPASNSYSSPVQIGSDTNWAKIAFNSGGSVTIRFWLAVKTDGTLWACGNNTYGQLGNGTNSNSYSSPIQIGSDTNWSQVACGLYHSLAIKTNGTLWVWGKNSNGELGLGDRTNQSSPVQVGSGTNWSKLPEHSAPWYESYAIRT